MNNYKKYFWGSLSLLVASIFLNAKVTEDKIEFSEGNVRPSSLETSSSSAIDIHVDIPNWSHENIGDLNQYNINANNKNLATSLKNQNVNIPKEVQEALQEKIASHYLIDPTLSKLRNHEQNFVANFDNGQTTITPILKSDNWSFEMKLISYGQENQLTPVGTGEISFHENQVAIDYGNVTEWFINRPTGLEHGFTVNAPSVGGENSLVFQMEIDTNLTSEVQSDNLGIALSHDDETTLYYSGLYVEDSNGDQLLASLNVNESNWTITVEGLQEAQYPITVDPTFLTVQKFHGSCQAPGDAFGQSMDTDGNLLVVGSIGVPNGQGIFEGVAYVFEDIGGEWVETAKLSSAKTQFATAVAIHGDWIAIGDPSNPINGTFSGSVSLLNRQSDGSWNEVQSFSGDASFNFFGFNLDLTKNWLTVTATGESTALPSGGAGQGTVHVYEFDSISNQWKLNQIVFSENPTEFFPPFPGEGFADSVSISGNTLMIGATLASNPQDIITGTIYIFSYDAMNQKWVESQRIYPSDTVPLMNFGRSVDFDRNFIAVGASKAMNDSGNLAGAVYVFRRDPSGMIVEESKLQDSDGVTSAVFGYAVDLFENKILVGAWGENLTNNIPGSAHLFTYRPGLGWEKIGEFLGDATNINDLGIAVTISNGNHAVVGDRYNGSLTTTPGKVYSWNLNIQTMKE